MAQTVQSSELLNTLQPNGLYILLYHHPNPSIKYHWGFYHHLNAEQGGWKFDIINPGGIWRLAHTYGDGNLQLGVLDPDVREPLGVMVRVGCMKDVDVKRVHEIVRAEDERLNQLKEELKGGISCRVYVMRACERLREVGLLRFGEWKDVQEEVLKLGDENQEMKGREAAVVDSKVADFSGEQ
jgi:hypothetical protein